MYLEHYDLVTGLNAYSYEFISVGIHGNIPKLILFQKMLTRNFYNLAFGDKISDTDFDDKIVTDNKDSEKVLATIVAAIYDFTEQHSTVWIYATGSTKSRTRLYRMGINKYLSVAKKDFEIVGKTEIDWEEYEPNKEYTAFAIYRK